jgi:MFS family permease
MTLRPWLVLIALALGRIGFGYQFQTIATLATDLVPRFGLSYAGLGSLVGAYMLLGVLTALPLGLLGRRFGDRLVLGGGLALMTLGSCVSAWVDGPSGIAVGRAAAGVGAVAMIVMQGKVIGEWFTGRHFMMAISVTVSAFAVGMGLAQLVLPLLLQAFGLSGALLSDAVPTGLACLLFLLVHRTPPHAVAAPRRFSLPSPHEWLLLSIAGVAWMSFTAGFSGFASYLPASLALRGESLAVIGLVMTIATWGNVPGTIAGGWLAVRLGEFPVVLAGTSAMVAGMLGLALAGWPVAWSVLLGVIGSIQPGVMMAVATLSAAPANRAAGMGIFYMVYYVGGTIAPPACGLAADAWGSPTGGLLAAALLSTLTVPLYLLHRAVAGRRAVV